MLLSKHICWSQWKRLPFFYFFFFWSGSSFKLTLVSRWTTLGLVFNTTGLTRNTVRQQQAEWHVLDVLRYYQFDFYALAVGMDRLSAPIFSIVTHINIGHFFQFDGGQFNYTTHLKEASNGSSSTLVSVHPSHEPTSLDVSSSSVIGDSLETPNKTQPLVVKWTVTCTYRPCSFLVNA